MAATKNMLKKVQGATVKPTTNKTEKPKQKKPIQSPKKRVAKTIDNAIIDAVKTTGDVVRKPSVKNNNIKAAKSANKQVNKGDKQEVTVTKGAVQKKIKERELVDTTLLIEPIQVTPQEEIFIHEIYKGTTQVESYKIAYPKSIGWKHNTLKTKASALFRSEVVQARYQDLVRKNQIIEQKKTGWTRETSREVLENLIALNYGELQRIDQAYIREREADLAALKAMQKVIEDENSKKGEVENATKDIIRINQRMINRDKERRISAVHNDAIINAVKGINDMYGFNDTNLDMAGMVVFKNKDKLQD